MRKKTKEFTATVAAIAVTLSSAMVEQAVDSSAQSDRGTND